MLKQDVSYLCAVCGSNRIVELDQINIKEDILRSPNGLIEVSDIHKCNEGQLSINNLHIDHNLAVRSFSLMELPDKKRPSFSIPGIPLPNQGDNLNTYRINKMLAEGGYRLILIDQRLKVNLNVGEVRKKELASDIIISNNETVSVSYYESDIVLRRNNKLWFQELVNAIEDLPPTRLGLFIEALRYVYDHNDQAPGDFEIKQLRTLLASHLTSFEVKPHNYRQLKNITAKYGEEKRPVIDQIITALKEFPHINLQELQVKVQEGLVFMIFLLIILEIEDILIIKREF